ncbi:MAG: ABC-2 transporter permease [Clostridia bacterium]|nr:ABC-2 transporter permease [Clostridia bacterium]
MFGKLLKNDLKAQWHSVNIILLCLAIICVVAEGFAILTDNDMLAALAGLLVFAVLVFACFVMVIAVSMLFSKTVFGRAGYLTLTLPARTRDLVWSKTVSGLIWIFGVFSLMILSMFIWVSQVDARFGSEIQAAADLLSLFGAPSISVVFAIVAVYTSIFAVLILLAVQCIYLGITLSNVTPFSRLGNFGAVIVTFVSIWVIVTLAGAVGDLLPMGIVLTESKILFTTDFANAVKTLGDSIIFRQNLTGIILSLAGALLLNLPITSLIKNKVNIK